MAKRTFDLIFLFIISPLIIILLVIIFLLSFIINKKDIFFIQDRGGYKGKKIKVIKFRTMEVRTKKINKFNMFLRKSHLDEIPQFINVFKGELSIVGPRPLFYSYKKFYSKEQLKRFNSKPGITGLTQITTNEKTPWKKKFQIDNWYTDNNNLILDITIIIKTAVIIFISFFNKKNPIEKEKFNGKN